jgi:hypothetical protein
MSLGVVRALSNGLAPFRPLGRMSLAELRGALRDAKRRVSHELPFGLMDLPAVLRVMNAEDFGRIRTTFGKSDGSMADVDFRNLHFPFAARVALSTVDGGVFEASRVCPDGAPGGKDRLAVAESKFRREAEPYLGCEQTAAVLSKIVEGSAPAGMMDSLLQNPGF